MASSRSSTATNETLARAFAARHQAQPVHRYELPPASENSPLEASTGLMTGQTLNPTCTGSDG